MKTMLTVLALGLATFAATDDAFARGGAGDSRARAQAALEEARAEKGKTQSDGFFSSIFGGNDDEQTAEDATEQQDTN